MNCNSPSIRNTVLVYLLCSYFQFAVAHHSSAMFDKTDIRTLNATVKEFQWANPHVWIQIYILNSNQEREEWSIEGIGINTLFRRGWRPNSFVAGDSIQISFNPMLDGTNAGAFIGAKFEDGKILGKWSMLKTKD